MEEISLREGEEFIKLGQFVIQDGLVEVSGEVELQRGKKIYPDDVVSFNGESVKVIRWLLNL